MAGIIIGYLGAVIEVCYSWFNQVLDATGMTGVWLAALVVTLSYKFILAPVFGVANSDTAMKSYNAFKSSKKYRAHRFEE